MNADLATMLGERHAGLCVWLLADLMSHTARAWLSTYYKPFVGMLVLLPQTIKHHIHAQTEERRHETHTNTPYIQDIKYSCLWKPPTCRKAAIHFVLSA